MKQIKRLLLTSLLCGYVFTVTQAQNYLINFTANGGSLTLNNVFVENLTSGVSLNLNGTDTLRLLGIVDIYEAQQENPSLHIYPNPMEGHTIIAFFLTEACATQLNVYDVTGKTLIQTEATLSQGTHSFMLSGLSQGVYFLQVQGVNFNHTKKLISVGTEGTEPQIVNTGSQTNIELNTNTFTSKSAKTIISMVYTNGDMMRFTGYVGSNNKVVVDVPTSSKTINFVFTQTLANDECVSAITLTEQPTCQPVNATTVGATQSMPAITCNGWTGTANDDVWFKFVATSTNPTIRVVGSTGFDAVIDLRSGACQGTSIACADNTVSGGTEELNAIGLTVGNTYYIRVYSYGTSSGTFTICVFSSGTTVTVPTVSTATTANITQTTAQSGGNVTNDGGATVTARGVCWGTNQNPTTSNSHSTDGTGTGSFTSNITGLSPNTTYYVRAYAINSAGTAYGNQVSFTTTAAPFTCGNNVTFNYGGTNVTYGTVMSAGNKCWLDRNLGAAEVATNSYNSFGDLFQWGRAADGHHVRTPAPDTTNTLSGSDIPGHSNFITNPSTPYDWRSPQNHNLWQGVSSTNNPCPSGWRVPTDAEWETERLSWGSNNAAGAFASPLKLSMGGYRLYTNGSVYHVLSKAYYWSSTVNSTFSRALYFDSSNSSMYDQYRSNGFAVRCIKD